MELFSWFYFGLFIARNEQLISTYWLTRNFVRPLLVLVVFVGSQGFLHTGWYQGVDGYFSPLWPVCSWFLFLASLYWLEPSACCGVVVVPAHIFCLVPVLGGMCCCSLLSDVHAAFFWRLLTGKDVAFCQMLLLCLRDNHVCFCFPFFQFAWCILLFFDVKTSLAFWNEFPWCIIHFINLWIVCYMFLRIFSSVYMRFVGF